MGPLSFFLGEGYSLHPRSQEHVQDTADCYKCLQAQAGKTQYRSWQAWLTEVFRAGPAHCH